MMANPEWTDPEDWEDVCWNCHGETVVYDCFEEWACIDPEGGCDLCKRRCDVCRPRKPTPLTEQEAA